MKASRSVPSEGISFNHQTLGELIRTTDSLKFWREILQDEDNKHLHRRARFKVRWLGRKESLLRFALGY